MQKIITSLLFLAFAFIGPKSISWAVFYYEKKQLVIEKNNNLIFDLEKVEKKPTIIVFWVSWCNICAKELKALNEINNENAKKFEIIAINYTPQDNDEGAKKFLQILNPSFKTVSFYDIKKSNLPRITNFPTTFIISADKQTIEKFEIENIDKIKEEIKNIKQLQL